MTSQPRAWVRENHRSKAEKRHSSMKRWEVVYVDPDTTKRRTKGGFTTKQSAQEWADEFTTSARRGEWNDPERMVSFSEVAARWFADQSFDRGNTEKGYRRIIEGDNDLVRTFRETSIAPSGRDR